MKIHVKGAYLQTLLIRYWQFPGAAGNIILHHHKDFVNTQIVARQGKTIRKRNIFNKWMERLCVLKYRRCVGNCLCIYMCIYKYKNNICIHPSCICRVETYSLQSHMAVEFWHIFISHASPLSTYIHLYTLHIIIHPSPSNNRSFPCQCLTSRRSKEWIVCLVTTRKR